MTIVRIPEEDPRDAATVAEELGKKLGFGAASRPDLGKAVEIFSDGSSPNAVAKITTIIQEMGLQFVTCVPE
jgi:Na+/H+-translocating membrane pyrophosphatase